jgi:HKD family nuclease
MALTLKATLIDQGTPGSEATRKRIIQLLKDPKLERVRFAVAFARWEGIGLIAASIEDFVSRGGRFESIYGAGNGITTPDALYYGILLKRLFPTSIYAGFVEDEYANASFHPKFYQFSSASRVRVIAGSVNLTGGGLQRNSEVSIEAEFARGSAEDEILDTYWKDVKKKSKALTVEHVLRISTSAGSAAEKSSAVSPKAGKPYLAAGTKPQPRPLFEKILGLDKPPQKTKEKLLSEFSAISERPKHLYIQILARETGGQKGNPGSAVQFPVATLGAYFGVAQEEDRAIRLKFPNGPVNTNITHFSNNTHQIRIQPILSITRPAVLHLERTALDVYKADFIPPVSYKKALAQHCHHQSRKNSRLWGFA